MKVKKSKRNLSDAIMAPKQQQKKLNPFEVHINRRKHDVLGMKSKAEKGLPGVSRSRAIKKRKATLLQEYKFKDKKNVFMDRRIGEKDKAMTKEDRMLARFAAERMRMHSKKSRYNLGDDEELTHKGQTLTEIEKYEDPRSDDEDDDDGPFNGGRLDADFVERAHFGGGVLTKVENESKNRKDLIDQLITESKKRKAEKQKLREETLELTEKLDTEWRELLPLITSTKKAKGETEMQSVEKKDEKTKSYDILTKELKFESKGKPSDRLKSEEEIAREEKERLEKLEEERIQRMKGETSTKKIKHRSADDLDDGFDIDLNKPFLSYDSEGLANVKDSSHKGNQNEEKSADSENSEEEEDEEENEDEDAEEEIAEEDEEEENENEEENEEEDDDADKDEVGSEEVEKSEESLSDDDSDDLSDMKESDESDTEIRKSKINESKKLGASKSPLKLEGKKRNISESSADEETEKKEMAEQAKKELPFTFEIPDSYKSFEKLMKKHDPNSQTVIIERMIKCNHPRIKEDAKTHLEGLFIYLLQHLHDYSVDDEKKVRSFELLDRLAPWFYDLTQWSPDNAANSLFEVIEEKYQDFKKNVKKYPSLDTLIFLKLVSVLFPTSDYQHSVVTPCFIFMQHMLSSCKIIASTDVSVGLFICTLILEYCSLSKKLVPEAINFLRGMLRLCHSSDSVISIIPPFKRKDMHLFSLEVSDKLRSYETSKLTVRDLIVENGTDEFKVRATSLALKLLSRFCDFWTGDGSAFLLFEPFVPLLDTSNYVECQKQEVEEVLSKIKALESNKLKKLVYHQKKPKPLRLYEPRIEEVYTLKKYRPMSKEKQERAKLVHKYKKEMKGALREIRRDRSFIAKVKLKEIQKNDIERQRKVKQILSEAAQQQGELRKLKRKK